MEGETGLRSGSSTAAAAGVNGELGANASAQDDLATEKREASARASEMVQLASDSTATLQPGAQEASVGVRGEACAANNRANALKPRGQEASTGAARSGGGTSGRGALLDWRTLRLCASFSLQARGPPSLP